ncbi:LuxR family transcriptional regulator [Bosea caraganae]|uniref:LuxR family transcriptional regulator n=1 Tax=Bosea caraganae TaxID=2763117 RepID=A0A370L6Q6_9HYPH|nr:helix-turn-helix transcriptional regulator [Bosea caraganae]RDJ25429.1 LuxR family transcriptional regulator [Bosea caraganae]RDJ25786.1 LuxR family transcriptional regulator [Bosea caraganae]
MTLAIDFGPRHEAHFTTARPTRHSNDDAVSDGTAVFLVTEDLRILSRNRDATRLTGEGIVGDDRFSTRSANFNARLQGWMRRNKAGAMMPELRLALETRSERVLAVSVTPIGAFADETRSIFAIVVRDHSRAIRSSIAAIKVFHGLTPSEAKMLGLVCEGLDTIAASERLGIAKTTARTHLQRLFAKTGTTRQSELVHFVVSFVPGAE